MSEHAAVLFANEAFYLAFSSRDLDAMDTLWARHDAVSCIHPGWPSLSGRDEVMGSWQNILGNAESPRITCTGARAFLLGDAAYVICYEVLDQGTLVATNVFTRENGAWKMVHHQAAPSPPPATDEPADDTAPVMQ